jgi:hypothetical protein
VDKKGKSRRLLELIFKEKRPRTACFGQVLDHIKERRKSWKEIQKYKYGKKKETGVIRSIDPVKGKRALYAEED